ncbi:AraC family ligand binding domain-containing protein [Klebsiella pneumoniae]|uniref:AraC family ligand binding domain-containing protein n=2 Tax=Enterobacter cloacae complex TaxID=354276 RepID=A0AAX3LJ31_9ENTR|nr:MULTISPECIES: AraC family ligand binding domain-containing protein [Enterobacter]MCW4756578.1 AraC family ligand binding domain-containing protein [Enterobacter hormaechei]WCE15992.1 AraC family ligand binding domain-containing protein [Enterobacter ludwigii]
MSVFRQLVSNLEHVSAPIVGSNEVYSSAYLAPHFHQRNQLLFATRGVILISTATGEWLLPSGRAIWINAGIEHSLTIKKPAEMCVLYIQLACHIVSKRTDCTVVDVIPLARELIITCASFNWDYATDTPEWHLVHVLLDQLKKLNRKPVELPFPSDSRGLKVAEILQHDPTGRRTLSSIANEVGASTREGANKFLI